MTPWPDGADPGAAPLPPCRRTQDSARLEAVVGLARRCAYEAGHTHQVTRLALALFDGLAPLHRLGEDERFWLQCGAMLHDIGVAGGASGHHKAALRLILGADRLPLDPRERLIIASVARYHRKTLPKETHDHFTALDLDDRRRVRALASILRVADGLDRSHLCLVRDVTCDVGQGRVDLRCDVRGPAPDEQWAAHHKGDLFGEVFQRSLNVEMRTPDG